MHVRALSTGIICRTLLSALLTLLCPPALALSGVGSGPAFEDPIGIAVEASGTLVVADPILQAVLRVDPVSGDRAIISDATTGSGPAFDFPQRLAVEASGTLVVVDINLLAVLRVNPTTGDRMIISQ